MTAHIATAAVVKVSIGASTGNRVARFIRRGDLVPDGVSEEQIDRLVERGLIAEFDVDEIVSDDADGDANKQGQAPAGSDSGSDDDEVQLPEGEPTKSWNHKQIDLWASRQEPVITFDADLSIAKKLEAIEAAKKS